MGAFRYIADYFRRSLARSEKDSELLPPRGNVGDRSSLAKHRNVAVTAIGTIWRNMGYTFRQMRRAPGFACATILTIALGIAANVAMFSIVWAVFLAPLPYPHRDRMVVVWTHFKGERNPTLSDDYAEYSAASRSFERLDFGSWRLLHLTNEDQTEDEIVGAATTPGFATRNSGLTMALGRDFRPDEGLPGTDHVTILNHSLWASRYHSDPTIIGKTIGISGEPYTVVGVEAPAPGDRGEGKFSVPVIVPLGSHLGLVGNIFGLLKPGATIAQAQAELATIDRRLAGKRNGGKGADAWSVSVEPLKNDWLDNKLARNLWLLFVAVGLVLLIACANVANLLLARGATRSQELAVRGALGASRGAIFSQLLVESLTLALIGGMLGIGMGWGLMKLAMLLLPNLVNQTYEATVGMNLPVLGFAFFITLLTGVLSGCAPAWKAGKVNLNGALSQGSRSMLGRSRSGVQTVLVAADFALALTLLSGAGMVLHSFWKLSHIDLGFNGDHVLTGFLGPSASTDLRNFKLPHPEQTVSMNRAVLVRLQSLPGVSSVGLSTSFPLQEHGTVSVAVSGAATDNPQRLTAGIQWVTPGYQQTFQIRLARGRFLNDNDRLGNPLSVVVNETLVHRYLQGADPLTQRLMIPLFKMGPGPPPAPQAYQIVGVVHDVADREHLTDAPQPEVFLSFWQTPIPYTAFEVRTAEDPAIVSGELRHALSAFPNLSVERVQAMQVAVENQFTNDRFETVLFAGFAAAALLLAAVGIYGVMAFSVTQRSHEIGLRIALGSPRPDVVRLMLRGGMRLALIGMVFGIGGAFLVGRLMQSTLYGVGALDPGSLAGVGAILIAVAMLACWIPARRAATIEPMRALRSE